MDNFLFSSGWIIYTLLIIRFIFACKITIPYSIILKDIKILPRAVDIRSINFDMMFSLIFALIINIIFYTLIYLKIPNSMFSILMCIYLTCEVVNSNKTKIKNFKKINESFNFKFSLPRSFYILTTMHYFINIFMGIMYLMYTIYFIKEY